MMWDALPILVMFVCFGVLVVLLALWADTRR